MRDDGGGDGGEREMSFHWNHMTARWILLTGGREQGVEEESRGGGLEGPAWSGYGSH